MDFVRPDPVPFPSAVPGYPAFVPISYYVAKMEVVMIGLIIALLVVWAILAIVGFTVKGLVWLAILGIILFAGTAAFGGFRRRSVGR
jgi:hypothetical protein